MDAVHAGYRGSEKAHGLTWLTWFSSNILKNVTQTFFDVSNEMRLILATRFLGNKIWDVYKKSFWQSVQEGERWEKRMAFAKLFALYANARSSQLERYSKTEIKTKFPKFNRGIHTPSKAKNCRPATPLKMKSTTAFFKDLDPKFGTDNYRTGTIAIKQKTFYSMAASEVVEIYIHENLQ